MLERTVDNCPAYTEVIEHMAARGHALAPDHLQDYAMWQTGSEQMAHLFRLVWTIATNDQLAELASYGGLMMEMAAQCLASETSIAAEGGADGK